MLTAHLALDSDRRIGDIDRRLFGGFVEHLGRHIYTGIYEPGHPTADDSGFRQDVIDLVRELGVTTVRYPGGNFVSGFRWEDSVGPRDQRPRRLNLAWHSTETNEVGLHEFADWLDRIGADLMLAVNLGTQGVLEALDLIEYTNLPGGTALSERRIANGRPEPFGVRMWCLGNEMDGPWQLGHRSADDYGKLAARTARAMRQFDPDLELVVCGSSSRDMPTFGQWERAVLSHTYDEVDFISCHAYYHGVGGDRASFLASGVDMDAFIEEVTAIADEVAAARGSSRQLQISFDEWNVWYFDGAEDKITGPDNWPVAPRLFERRYTVLDAVVFGGLLISLLKHADRVASASLAQLVNAIAPILTEPGGPAWRQTTFYPFATASRLARGAALRPELESPTVTTPRFGTVPVLDAVATHDEETGRLAAFLVNRSEFDSLTVTIDLTGFGAVEDATAHTLSDDDLAACNTLEDPDRVRLQPNGSVTLAGTTVTVELPPVSWTALDLLLGPNPA